MVELRMVVAFAAEQAAQEQRRQMLLASLLTAFLGAQLRARAVRPRGRGDAFNVDDIPDLLAQLQAGATFVRPHRDFRLQLTDSHLIFDSLHGEHGGEVTDFRLELRRGEDTLWSAEGIEGKATLPMEELERAVTDGADQLLILTAGEEE